MLSSLITVSVKNVYGKETIYPACETANKLCSLTGKKTFSIEDLKVIRSLGFEVKLLEQTLSF